MKLTTQDLIARARFYAAKKLPYLSKSLWACTFIETPDVPTIGIDDKWRVFFNPKYVRECADARPETLSGELIHEIMHPTFRHKSRGKIIGAADREHWNCCGDAEIDQQIVAASVTLVDKRVRPADLGGQEGMTAEELYRLPREPGASGASGAGHCAGGSGAGNPMPWEKAGNAPEAPVGLTEAEAEIVRAGTAQAIQKHEKSRPGTVPSGILRWAETFSDAPPVDWRALVAAKVRYAIDSRRGSTPSYARPSRRLVGSMILPVHRMPVPRIRLIVDTSGSMREHDLSLALACVVDACEALGRLSVVSCDAAASEPVEVRHVDDLREYLLGGGGTDMRVGLAKADADSPDAIVCVTDGETPWPDEAPDVPVTIVLTREPDYGCVPPAWAEVIRVA